MAKTWNYRVIRRRSERDGEEWYRIGEVHYEGGSAVAVGPWKASPGGDSIDELRGDLELMLKALELPALDEESVIGSPAPPRSTLED